MTIAAALFITALCTASAQGPTPTTASPASTTIQAQQASSCVVFAADIAGRVEIYDRDRQLVVKLDKPAGRPLQVALAPGAYEARFAERGFKPVRFQLAEGDQFVIERASVEELAAPPSPAAGGAPGGPVPPPPARALDSRHRIEVRGGGWADGWYNGGDWDDWDDWDDCDDWHTAGTAHGAFGFEYLNFVRNDLGIGVAINSLVRAEGDWGGWDNAGVAQVITSVPVVVRWYPVRRVTLMRAVEPYVTAGIGPVFGVDTKYADWNGCGPHDGHGCGVASTRVATAFGGRVGGGLDVRLGGTFTLGVSGAWNWDTGFPSDLWRGERPSGGEFAFTMGWNFGR